MFRRLLIKLKGMLADPAHAPSNPNMPPTQQAGPINNVNTNKLNKHQSQMQPTIQSMRNNIIQNEFAEEIQSESRRNVRIVPAGPETANSRERRSFTEDGLITTSEDYLLHTSDGRFITGQELHGGGQCFVCRGFTDKKNLAFCSICRCPLCFSCAHPWKDNKVCPAHYRYLYFNQDTWTEDQEDS